MVFAFARAQGTVLEPIREMLNNALTKAQFHVVELSFDELIWEYWMGTADYYHQPNFAREAEALKRADELRAESREAHAMMRLALGRLAVTREAHFAEARRSGRQGVAWILGHLVHPDEVNLLRRHFGSRAFVIAVFEPLKDRRATLVSRYRQKPRGRRARLSVPEATRRADDMLAKSAGIEPSGDAVRDSERASVRPDLQKTFPLADLFLNVHEERIERQVRGKAIVEIHRGLDQLSIAKLHQLVAQIVGYPFATPDVDEAGMAHAYQARVSSASLGRQVGAAIVSEAGDLLAIGWNDVPTAEGGVYRQHYTNLEFLSKDFDLRPLHQGRRDYRDHRLTGERSSPAKGDSNSRIRYSILADLLHQLESLGALNRDTLDGLVGEDSHLRVAAEALDLEALAGESSGVIAGAGTNAKTWAATLLTQPRIKRAAFSAMLEYGRSVHAEMNAITTAARLGLSLRSSTLYSTTFPCHECARHIIASGISRVIYIEPFPKSRVFELHKDAVENHEVADDLRDAGEETDSDVNRDADGDVKKVQFLPFIGISPWRHEELFAMVHRKKLDQQEVSDDAKLQHPADLWAVADWTLKTGRLRPAFRLPPPVAPFEDIIARGKEKADEARSAASVVKTTRKAGGG